MYVEGGDITYSEGYSIHTFETNGVLNVIHPGQFEVLLDLEESSLDSFSAVTTRSFDNNLTEVSSLCLPHKPLYIM